MSEQFDDAVIELSMAWRNGPQARITAAALAVTKAHADDIDHAVEEETTTLRAEIERLRPFESDWNRLAATVNEQRAEVSALTRQRDAMEEERNDAHEIAAKMEAERDAALARAEALEEDCARLTEKDERFSKAIVEAVADLADARNALAASEQARQEAERQRDGARAEVSRLCTAAAKDAETLDAKDRALAAARSRVDEMVRENDSIHSLLDAVTGERDAARAEGEALRGALREVVRRSGLPIEPKVTGLPSTEVECADAIAKCVRLAVEHVAEPARALSGPSATTGGSSLAERLHAAATWIADRATELDRYLSGLDWHAGISERHPPIRHALEEAFKKGIESVASPTGAPTTGGEEPSHG